MATKPVTFKTPPEPEGCTHWDFEIIGRDQVRCRLCGASGLELWDVLDAFVDHMKAAYHPWLDPVGAPQSRVVEVKTASGHTFRAKQLPAGYLPKAAMKRGGWFWVATGDAHGEEPPDWDNRICWDCNEEGRPSSPVIGWRELVL